MAAKIPERFLSAKLAAIEGFLGTGEEFDGLTALAASTRPKHNVVGVGIGPKLKGGKLTKQRSIRFYVERKLAAPSILQEFLIPREIRGVPTDVIETGRFYAFATPIA